MADHPDPVGEAQDHPTVLVDNVPVTIHLDFDRDQCFLGRGSFADVYKYLCPDTRKCVALKHLKHVIPKRCERLCAKFQREVDVHKELNHLNILRFIDTIKDPNAVYLVLEYAGKGSIQDLMKHPSSFDRSKILSFTVQILNGLEYLHNFSDVQGKSRRIVHRDLRCANILLTKEDTVKIADFGICKMLQTLGEASGDDTKVGNAYWLAPELVEKKPGTL